MHIPIERFVVNIMDEVPLPDLGSSMVAYEENVNFYRPIDQYPPYADVSPFEYLLITSLSDFRELLFKTCLKH
jgi:hypothetical protein